MLAKLGLNLPLLLELAFITAFLDYFDKADPNTDVIAGICHSIILRWEHSIHSRSAHDTDSIIMADFVANVPDIVVPRFEPNFFAQSIEKYRISVRLFDEDEGDIPPGQEKRGELWVRKYLSPRFFSGFLLTPQHSTPSSYSITGPNIMKGYLNNPTATKNAITPTAGSRLVILRPWMKKELIKYKGFQVPPAELEAMLLSRPAILDASVIGLESMEAATGLPCAYVVAERNAELLKDSKAAAAFGKEVEEWIEAKVTHHKSSMVASS
ncbi:hypothetical protein BS47DRAFT_1392160 [Hydnum rufescens UP504]|uniref:Uncharacterized protein n=1 Tax=Hydnum rufescens UP504 TaxID=1448309 RepID=A0A9P6AZL0_9AGAM|nr:hypothetical protein BS47DRAFT_1392160 [Hydnum rufescens UP504]